MKIRKSTVDDIPRMLEIYAHAKQVMIKNNNPHQWERLYPTYDILADDIKNGFGYVFEENNRIFATFALISGKDPTYSYFEGKWLNDYPYLTIHRIASDNTVHGVLQAAIEYAFRLSSTVRIDTHKDNSLMLHLLEKLGFTYCGIIYLSNGEPRKAFQKSITINTDRLVLRKIDKSDCQAIYDNWAKYPEVTEYMTWLPHASVEVTEKVMNFWIEEYRTLNAFRYGITLKDSGELIGMIDIVHFHDGDPEIGYVLSPKYWNNGYMTEACTAIVNELFKRGYNKVIIGAHVANKGSNRVIEKVGGKFTHRERRPMSAVKPELVDVNYYIVENNRC